MVMPALSVLYSFISADILSVMMNTAPPMNRQGDVGFDCREEAARFTRDV